MAKRIDKHEWISFLDRFSEDHQNERVEIDDLGDGKQNKKIASNLPLIGISADEDLRSVSIMVGDKAPDHITHIINHPSSVEMEDCQTTCLVIRGDRKAGALVRLM